MKRFALAGIVMALAAFAIARAQAPPAAAAAPSGIEPLHFHHIHLGGLTKASIDFRNETQQAVRVVMDNNRESRDIAPGGTFSLTFQHPGTYYYHCRHHAGMQATIVVPGASAPTAAQPAGPGPADGVVAAGR